MEPTDRRAVIQPGAVINRIEEGLIALFLAVMTFLTALQVLLRYVFNSGLIWSLEATTYTFAWLVLLGMSYGIRTRSHIAVDLVVGRLEGGPKRVIIWLSLAICLAYALLMFWGATVFVQRLFELGNDARDIPAQRWLLTLMMPVGFALLAWRVLELARQFATGRIDALNFGSHHSNPFAEVEDPEQVNGKREP